MAQPSVRFALSVQILALLATHRGEALTSARIAGSVGSNPAFVRRILGDLTRAGLTEGRLGKDGGALLAKGPKRITLADVYRASSGERLVPHPKDILSGRAFEGEAAVSSLPFVLGAAVDEAEAAFFATLEGISLKQVVKAIS